jgi:hypothetical protein
VPGRRIVGTNLADKFKGTGAPDQIRTRGGKDGVRVGGGSTDKVDCGGGKDKVIADESDRVKHCEIVRLPGAGGGKKKA